MTFIVVLRSMFEL